MTEDKSAGWGAYYEKLRERPPRRTLITALDRFGPAAAGSLAVDLGCGDGRDVIEMLHRGWRVVAVDAEPEALRQLQARPLPAGHDLTPIQARFEDVPLPIGLSLVNSSFAMPLCEPEAFHRLWERIREALAVRRTLQRAMVRPARFLGRPSRHDLRRPRRGACDAGRPRAGNVRGGRGRRRHAARQRQALAHLPYRCAEAASCRCGPEVGS